MTTSNAGIELIKNFEGFKRESYWDNGQYSIGYGHRAANIKKGQTTTEQEAEAWLKQDVAGSEGCITRNFIQKGIALTQSQFDACVSLVYNIGCSGFVGTDAAKALQGGDTAKFRELLLTTKVGNYEGLKKRRAAELALFNGSAKQATATASASGAEQTAGGTDWGKVAIVTGVMVGVGSLVLSLSDFVLRWLKKR